MVWNIPTLKLRDALICILSSCLLHRPRCFQYFSTQEKSVISVQGNGMFHLVACHLNVQDNVRWYIRERGRKSVNVTKRWRIKILKHPLIRYSFGLNHVSYFSISKDSNPHHQKVHTVMHDNTFKSRRPKMIISAHMTRHFDDVLTVYAMQTVVVFICPTWMCRMSASTSLSSSQKIRKFIKTIFKYLSSSSSFLKLKGLM